MIGASRSARIAALGYGIVAVLVLGGLTWASIASLRLQQSEAEAAARAEHRRRVRLALWRIDPLVMNVLAKEASRPYWYYSAYYYPSRVLFTSGQDATGAVIEPSPLLSGQDVEEWILLHFQVSWRGGWSSPRILTPSNEWLAEAGEVPEAVTPEGLRLLAALENAYSPEAFTDMVVAAQSAARRWTIGEETADRVEEREPPMRQRTQQQAKPSQQARSEFRQRGEQTRMVQTINRPPQACDPMDVALNNLNNIIAVDLRDRGQAEDTAYVSVNVSPMTAMWLRLPGAGEPLLAMVRTVEAGGDTVCQGFIVGWEQLTAMLVETVADLFDDAELRPVDPGTVPDPDNTLASLPAQLVTVSDPPAVTGWWQRMDTSLWGGWTAAVAALVAVGLGVRSLLLTSERRSQFAYAVTHELRTPLTTLQLYSDMLADGMVSQDRKAEYLDTLRQQSKRLADLVGAILDYSEVEKRGVRPERRVTSIRELTETVVAAYEPRCQRAGATLHTQINGLGDRTVETDPRLVVQVVGNLLDNACKYGCPGKGGEVTLRALPEGPGVALEIEDNGPGIGRSDRRQVFKAFRRGQAGGSRATGGVGLGLALARSWARLLGGRLELMPARPGRGACFRLTLPSAR
jgi:signal transduction histidine kinase